MDLLRHGEVEGANILRGITDDPLSPRGQIQMQRSLRGLAASCPWQQVVTSPLKRCATFANIIASECQIPVSREPGLAEINFGAWEGQTIMSIHNDSPDLVSAFWNNPFDVTPPQGESPGKMKTRVLRAWTTLLEQHAHQHRLIITHGGPIRVILGTVLSMPDAALNKIEVAHASLTRIRIPADGWPPSLVFHAPPYGV